MNHIGTKINGALGKALPRVHATASHKVAMKQV
jgi:hypothetical protein